MDYIKMVEEFQKMTKSPVLDVPTIINQNRFNLRLDLIVEETDELMEAYNDKNKVEILDALCDLQYVLTGMIIEMGFQHVFNDAFAEVHRSNMSKRCSSLDEAERTVAIQPDPSKYVIEQDGEYYLVIRNDGKITKSVMYSEAKLIKFING
jgi:predicted HAD superfamily Cof-like phosphohydrolase